MAFGKKQYVVDIKENGDIVLGDDKDLYSDRFVVDEINFQAVEDFEEGKEYNYFCKVRYRDKGSMCSIKKFNNKLYCHLDTKARAITKGQSAVFYDEDVIVCGGTISSSGGFDEEI